MRTANLTIQLAGESTSEPPAFFLENKIHSVSSGSGYDTVIVDSESWIVKSTFSTVVDSSQWELSQHYRALGTALNELTTLEEDDDWKIDASVYNAASYIATELRSGLMPPPQIFVHGPTSVVFNWSGGIYNFYLTIGANNVSALLSSPGRILRRIEYPENEWPNAVGLLPFIRSVRSDSPVLLSSSATSDLPDFFG
jgi:hypothetical protein